MFGGGSWELEFAARHPALYKVTPEQAESFKKSQAYFQAEREKCDADPECGVTLWQRFKALVGGKNCSIVEKKCVCEVDDGSSGHSQPQVSAVPGVSSGRHY